MIVLPFAAPHLARDWPVIRKHAGMMVVFAFTGVSAYNTLAYYGLQYTSAINGLLLQSIGPLFVALWTFALFGDRLTWRQAPASRSRSPASSSSSAAAVSRSSSASASTAATSCF